MNYLSYVKYLTPIACISASIKQHDFAYEMNIHFCKCLTSVAITSEETLEKKENLINCITSVSAWNNRLGKYLLHLRRAIISANS